MTKEAINKGVEAPLKIKKEKFVELLNTQITKGNSLLQKDIPITSMYDDVQIRVVYDEFEKNSFIENFNRWHDYNVELYKTSFSTPNSTYRYKYESHAYRRTSIYYLDEVKQYKDMIRHLCNQMKADVEKIELIPCIDGEVQETQKILESKNTSSIFIVHGHDDSAINEVKVFLMKIGFDPIILREQPNEGQTIIEKIEKNTNVGFGIVLYSPCDEGKAKNACEYKKRARQNVVFEHGYLCAKLGRSNVCALVKGDLEIPGDLDGVVYTPMITGWELKVAKELDAAGYKFDTSKLLK